MKKLGEGGAGTVYKAYDRRRGRTVALKLMHPVPDSPGRSKVGRSPAEVTALSLDHPNILPLEGLETLDDGRLLLVMPFVEGKTLEKLLVPVAVGEALKLVTQTASGLAYAHDQGVLHCDVKPANLMLSRGTVRILDFGLARLLTDPAEGLVGTLEYMSPEAARGQVLTVTSDLWSLGVVFYELLTGRSPFSGGSSAAVLRRIAQADSLPPSRLRPGLPPGTDTVIGRLLSKDPSQRYPDAAALLGDLAALTEGKPPSVFGPARAGPSFRAPPTAGLSSVSSNMPPKPVLLLGRDDERALLALYLQDPECRLLSLQGLGGVGKTHLSLWVGQEQQDFTHVHFVALADTGAGGLFAALAAALGVQEGGGLEVVQGVIGSRRQLLILDNFEHLRSQAALLEALLVNCSNLTIFLTTRERLALEAEWVVPLGGLSVPPQLPEPTDAHRYGSLALFAHKASVSGRPFDLERHIGSVFGICSRLQGHPLGISLAAGLLGGLSPAEVEARLKHSFALLKKTPSGQDGGRHRSLQAVFEESFSLLTPEQQHLLGALSLFEGGFEAAAAAAVTGADTVALAALLDRSLLELSLEGRYVQHPMIHGFARERLRTAPADLRSRYARRYREHYLGVLRKLNERLKGRGRKQALEQLGRDRANFSVTLRREPRQLGADEAEPLRTFYTHYGRYVEGLALFERARGPYAQACAGWFLLLLGELERAEQLAARFLEADDAQLRLLSLNTQAGILARKNELNRAKALTLTALALAERLADEPMVAACMTNLALLEEFLGNVLEAVRYYQQSLTLSEINQNHPQTLTNLNNLAALYLSSGADKVDEAKALLKRALVLSESSKLTRMKPLLQGYFGYCLYLQGDYVDAEATYLEAYKVLLEREDKTMAVTVQAYLGQNCAAQGEPEKAHDWLLAGLRQASQLGDAEGLLCVLVRFAELFKNQDEGLCRMLAVLVYRHPFADPADRQLARRLTGGSTPILSLEDATEALVAAATLEEAASALIAALTHVQP